MISPYTTSFFCPPNTHPSFPMSVRIDIYERFIHKIDITTDVVAHKGLIGIRVIIGDGVNNGNVLFFPRNVGEWIRKQDVWTGTFDLGRLVKFPQPILILATSMAEVSGDLVSAAEPHWVSISVHASSQNL